MPPPTISRIRRWAKGKAPTGEGAADSAPGRLRRRSNALEIRTLQEQRSWDIGARSRVGGTEMNRFSIALAGVCAAALAALSACDNGPSAVKGRDRDHNVSDASYRSGGSYNSDRNYSRDRNDKGGSDADGGGSRGSNSHDTWWASSRKRSASESARAQFERDGAQFGAADVNDYAATAHAFISHPPKGTLTLERKNGDVLLYDPKTNVFAVANRDGAPRTMFKPDQGMAYWEQQKAREAGRKNRSRSDDQG